MATTWYETQALPPASMVAMGRLLQAAVLLENAQRTADSRALKAREAGCTWEAIGSALGMTRQGAQQRYSGGDAA